MPALRLDRRAGSQRLGDPGEDRVYVCIGIAARDDAHLEILASLANILIEPDQASLLREATQPDVVLAVLAPALQEAPPESKETSHPDSTPTRAG